MVNGQIGVIKLTVGEFSIEPPPLLLSDLRSSPTIAEKAASPLPWQLLGKPLRDGSLSICSTSGPVDEVGPPADAPPNQRGGPELPPRATTLNGDTLEPLAGSSIWVKIYDEDLMVSEAPDMISIQLFWPLSALVWLHQTCPPTCSSHHSFHCDPSSIFPCGKLRDRF